MAQTVPLIRVRSELEGDDICERLRAGGIKCAVAALPDANSIRAIWGRSAPEVLTVLVLDSDLEKAREVISSAEQEAKDHRVSVWESQPLGDDPGRIGTGFESVCECEWTGSMRESSEEAFEDARGHSSNIALEIVRAAEDQAG
jgi:hypothetical protein